MFHWQILPDNWVSRFTKRDWETERVRLRLTMCNLLTPPSPSLPPSLHPACSAVWANNHFKTLLPVILICWLLGTAQPQPVSLSWGNIPFKMFFLSAPAWNCITRRARQGGAPHLTSPSSSNARGRNVLSPRLGLGREGKGRVVLVHLAQPEPGQGQRER